jgi:hypothetical protein
VTVVLALLLLQPAAPQAEAERLFGLGLRLVAEGDTAGAVAAWEGARATGWASAAVEHNLGTTALRRGDAGRARLHLERAARLAPSDGAVARNLQLARAAAGGPPQAGWRRAFDGVVGVVRPLGLVALALALVFGALGLVLRGRRRPALGVGAVAVLAVGVASLALWERTRPAGVVLEAADVREGPSGAARSVARVRPGEAVEVGGAAAGWRRVEADGAAGWVPAAAVEAL